MQCGDRCRGRLKIAFAPNELAATINATNTTPQSLQQDFQ